MNWKALGVASFEKSWGIEPSSHYFANLAVMIATVERASPPPMEVFRIVNLGPLPTDPLLKIRSNTLNRRIIEFNTLGVT